MRVLSLGAGIQSTTVALMSTDGTLPPIDHAIFADTGWEPRAVYEHLDRLQPHLEARGVPVHRVSAGNIRDDATTAGHGFASMPVFVKGEMTAGGMMRRQCTREYKVQPINAKLRELAGIGPRARPSGVLVELVMGISWDEAQRMRDPNYAWITNEYPLVDARKTRHDCNLWLADHWPHPVTRSACIGCPYRSDKSWRDLPAAEFADAVAFEQDMQKAQTRMVGTPYLHRRMIPLDQVDMTTEEDHGQQTLWGDECEGMCGI